VSAFPPDIMPESWDSRKSLPQGSEEGAALVAQQPGSGGQRPSGRRPRGQPVGGLSWGAWLLARQGGQDVATSSQE
jgi:hypothetical protein